MKGTPFVFQVEEIGMTNVAYERIGQFRDIETLGQYQGRMVAGETEADFIAAANENGRDNARKPMHWDATDWAGFSKDEPWIEVNSNYVEVNVACNRANPNGIFQFYKRLFALGCSSIVIKGGSL